MDERLVYTWNRAQQSRVCAVEINYLRGDGMTRCEAESNESLYERCGKGTCANGMVWCSRMDEEKYFR